MSILYVYDEVHFGGGKRWHKDISFLFILSGPYDLLCDSLIEKSGVF